MKGRPVSEIAREVTELRTALQAANSEINAAWEAARDEVGRIYAACETVGAEAARADMAGQIEIAHIKGSY
jgi:hypothetical protein